MNHFYLYKMCDAVDFKRNLYDNRVVDMTHQDYYIANK